MYHMLRRLYLRWSWLIIYHNCCYSHLYLESSSSYPSTPSRTALKNLSELLHPILSHHFIQHSRSSRPGLFTAPNNPPAKAPSSRSTMAPHRTVQAGGGDECLHICGTFPQQIMPTLTGFRCFLSLPTAVREVGKVVFVHSHSFHKQYDPKNDVVLNLNART